MNDIFFMSAFESADIKLIAFNESLESLQIGDERRIFQLFLFWKKPYRSMMNDIIKFWQLESTYQHF